MKVQHPHPTQTSLAPILTVTQQQLVLILPSTTLHAQQTLHPLLKVGVLKSHSLHGEGGRGWHAWGHLTHRLGWVGGVKGWGVGGRRGHCSSWCRFRCTPASTWLRSGTETVSMYWPGSKAPRSVAESLAGLASSLRASLVKRSLQKGHFDSPISAHFEMQG